MSAHYQPNPNEPRAGGPVQPESHLEPKLLLQNAPKPWFINLFETLKELSAQKNEAPLQVSFRPMTEQDLLNSEDPELRQLAEMQRETSFFKSLTGNLKELFSPEQLPPLQVTARPLTEEELKNSTFAELNQATKPWYLTIFSDIKDMLFPAKLPPLEVTSKPVQVKQLFDNAPNRGGSFASSILIQCALVALAVFLGTNKTIQSAVKKTTTMVLAPTDLAPMAAQPQKKTMGGGGGGGDNSPLPPSKGRLPKPSPKQFTPPMAVVNNDHPRLMMEPTILAPENTVLPNVNMAQYGDPFAKMGPPSNGPGSGGGIGTGRGGGVGSGDGGGYGPGSGGGFGGGAFKIGGGVSAPVPIFKVEPEYSEEARKAKFQGTVLLAIVVDETGKTANVRVLRTLGMGLDEKAIEAVQKWKFRPGMKEGKAVPVMANVEVNFRLL